MAELHSAADSGDPAPPPPGPQLHAPARSTTPHCVTLPWTSLVPLHTCDNQLRPQEAWQRVGSRKPLCTPTASCSHDPGFCRGRPHQTPGSLAREGLASQTLPPACPWHPCSPEGIPVTSPSTPSSRSESRRLVPGPGSF